ncbi:MAG: cyclic-di-AMP receptor [Clostridiales bacterium]|nr:cyclic-di-AMP receptor [Clostridiales bacterium]
MKLIIAVVNNADSKNIIDELNEKGFKVTKFCSSGGFLKVGNTTLLTGVRKSKVDEAINIIKRNSTYKSYHIDYRKEAFLTDGYAAWHSYSMDEDNLLQDDMPASWVGDKTSGTVIFVINIKRYEKVINLLDN